MLIETLYVQEEVDDYVVIKRIEQNRDSYYVLDVEAMDIVHRAGESRHDAERFIVHARRIRRALEGHGISWIPGKTIAYMTRVAMYPRVYLELSDKAIKFFGGKRSTKFDDRKENLIARLRSVKLFED